MYTELREAAERVSAGQSDGLDLTFMPDILTLVAAVEKGYYTVSASREIWVGGDYNGHRSSTLDYWRFPTLQTATSFVEKFDWSKHSSKPFIQLTPWSTP